MFSRARKTIRFFCPKHQIGNTWTTNFAEVIWLGTSNLDGDEHLVRLMRISQHQLDWEEQRTNAMHQLEYRTSPRWVEFLLGYRNEYGKITIGL